MHSKNHQPRRSSNRKPHLYNQPAIISILGLDCSLMQPHRARGDREAEAGSSGFAIAIVFNSIEGPEDFFDRSFRHALAVITDANYRE
jgi:hypothetical protein